MKFSIMILCVLAGAACSEEQAAGAGQANDVAPDDIDADSTTGVCIPLCGYGETCIGINNCVKCFHGGNIVRTKDGEKMIKDLHINDQVLVVGASGELIYEPVIVDIHRQPHAKTNFYQISTNTARITLTAKHYLYVGCTPDSATLITSESVREGDWLLVHSPEDSVVRCEAVRGVMRVAGTGLYNPVVASGNIVVGGAVASVYSDDIPPLSARTSHALMWLVRQAHRHLPAFLLHYPTVSSGMPLWAYYLNVARDSAYSHV